MTALHHADAPFTAGPPFLPVAEPALLLFPLPFGALGVATGNADALDSLFVRLRGLRILDLATGKSRKLETGSEYDVFPDWSPRGDWIAFTSRRDSDYEIYRIRPDGSDLQRLTHTPGKNAHSSFSPDGEWIAFSTGRQGFKDEAIHLLLAAPVGLTFQPYGEIAVMRADGSNVHLLTDNSTEEGAPSWIPARKQ